MKAVQLKTDYRHSPLGIDNQTPLFSWKCEGGIKQSAFRVLAKDESGTEIFDSGKVQTDSMRCRYSGNPLVSRQRVTWGVTLWDEKKREEQSEIAAFDMGLLNPGDWQADWICGVDTDKEERLPADYYKRDFNVSKPIKSARLYATACGVYTALVNGKRVSDILAPGYTQYDKRLYYQTYDVTNLLLMENNSLEFTVGDGWYKGKVGNDNLEYMYGGYQTKLLAQLEIKYEDGIREVIGTDSQFLWCNDGPVGYNDMKDGEVYNAGKTPSYSANAVETAHNIHPIANLHDGIFEHERFVPKLEVSPSGRNILNFGQNLAGYVRFKPNGKPGDTITIKMFEITDHGEYTDVNIRNPALPDFPAVQQITYICGEENNWFQPDFFCSGFQYALVEGMDSVNPTDFEAVALYSKMNFTGQFSCSNESINKFLCNTVWSLKSNFADVPTDCPHREKNGWTGDAQVFAKTAVYLADTYAFFRKWLKDVRDCQREDGRVANVCPKTAKMGMADVLNGSVGWADAAVIIPYTLWKSYGDINCVTENYDLMHGWKEYVIKAASDKSIYQPAEDGSPQKQMEAIIKPFLLPYSPYNRFIIESGLHWGEWCEPGVDSMAGGYIEIAKPKQEVTCAYMHYSMTLLEEMLLAIDKSEEAAQCKEYADGAKAAYNFHFVKDNDIEALRQAPYVRALALGLLDGEAIKNAAHRLNEMVVNGGYKVGTGFLSTPFILQVLMKHGYGDTAYTMLENKDAPSWLAMVEQGATTVCEHYEIYNEDGSPKSISLNHYSLGAVCGFLFDTVCGISVAGENRFVIKPIPGGSLEWAEASYDSVYGKVTGRWERNENGYTLSFEIPANTSAAIHLPDGKVYEAGSGTYTYAGHHWGYNQKEGAAP
ncbi:MAG: glycoside hydrolase family 78 protein [Oscillospiraceae bacterium]|nr:glycoside hydrolase family 78 protein [Oscillospiraceae bacterium]